MNNNHFIDVNSTLLQYLGAVNSYAITSKFSHRLKALSNLLIASSNNNGYNNDLVLEFAFPFSSKQNLVDRSLQLNRVQLVI